MSAERPAPPVVRAVLFDAGGVLVAPDPAAIGPVLEAYTPGGMPTARVLVVAHYAGMRAQHDAADDHDDWDAYRIAYCRSAGVPDELLSAAVDALHDIWSSYLWRYPLWSGVRGLAALRAAGVPVGIVSNASGQIEACLANQGVCQVGPGAGVPVRVVVDSHVVGVAKPDPAIWGFALDVLGLEPDEVAYVGDSVRNDVVGAAGAGLHPFHLDPFDHHAGAPWRRIRRVSDMLALVEGGAAAQVP